MTILHVRDSDNGEVVEIDTTEMYGTYSVVDANTGEIAEVNLNNPTGIINVVDANTGEIVPVNLASPTGTLNVLDANTGKTVAVNLANPNSTVTVPDRETGEMVSIDLSKALVLHNRETLVIGNDTYPAGGWDYTLDPNDLKLGDFDAQDNWVVSIGTCEVVEGEAFIGDQFVKATTTEEQTFECVRGLGAGYAWGDFHVVLNSDATPAPEIYYSFIITDGTNYINSARIIFHQSTIFVIDVVTNQYITLLDDYIPGQWYDFRVQFDVTENHYRVKLDDGGWSKWLTMGEGAPSTNIQMIYWRTITKSVGEYALGQIYLS